MHLAFSVAATVCFTYVLFKELAEREARVALVVFFLLPVSATSYYWVGSDSLTFFLMTLLLLLRKHYIASIVVALCLGLQHFEISFFAVGALLFSLIYSKYVNLVDHGVSGMSIRWAIAVFVGVIIGKLLLVGIFELYNMQVNSGRIYWWEENAKNIFSQFIVNFHFIVWSTLNLGWIIFFKYVDNGKQSLSFVIPFLGLVLLLSAISEDQTRVVALSTFLLIAAYWLLNEAFLRRVSSKLISSLFLLWLIVPFGWSWVGKGRNSVIIYDVYSVFLKIFNSPVSLSPFN
jgi:hypothetical protein